MNPMLIMNFYWEVLIPYLAVIALLSLYSGLDNNNEI